MTAITVDTDAVLGTADTPAASGPPVTEKQVAFARSLYREIRDSGYDADLLATLGEQGKRAKGEGRRSFAGYIDALIDVRDTCRRERRAPRPAQPQGGEVEAGRYALRGEDGVVRFYEVDKPTEGRWAGYTFVSQRASDERHAVRDRAQRERILAAIAADPDAAATLFGVELGICYACGRSLTDEESRRLGIGPVCRSRA